jgi:hypothetical protein
MQGTREGHSLYNCVLYYKLGNVCEPRKPPYPRFRGRCVRPANSHSSSGLDDGREVVAKGNNERRTTVYAGAKRPGREAAAVLI